MAVSLPRLCLLLLLLDLGYAREQRCRQADYSCDKCIGAGPECAWCSSPNATVRCHTAEELQKAGCTDVYNPESSLTIQRNEPRPERSETVFMRPQELSISLRPGRTETVRLDVIMPAGQRSTRVDLEATDVPSGLTFALVSNMTGNPGLVEVTVGAAQCPSRNQNMTGPWFVYVVSKDSPQRVKIEIHLECHCSCSLNREERSPACGARGAHVCGHCECYHHYTGERCHTEEDSDFPVGDASCQPHSNAPLCSGRGLCVQGDCWCDSRISPRERYSGRFCECNNFNCPYSNNKLCGGHGRCECGHCVCDVDWAGEACECFIDMSPCMAKNGQVCNGRGVCNCGVCRCTSSHFMGPTCEDCPLCQGLCPQYSACVECRAFGTGEMAGRCDKECNNFSMTMVETSNHLPTGQSSTARCKEYTRHDDCYFHFSIQRASSDKNVTVARNKDCRPR